MAACYSWGVVGVKRGLLWLTLLVVTVVVNVGNVFYVELYQIFILNLFLAT